MSHSNPLLKQHIHLFLISLQALQRDQSRRLCNRQTQRTKAGGIGREVWMGDIELLRFIETYPEVMQLVS
jgi:hypothetical protein